MNHKIFSKKKVNGTILSWLSRGMLRSAIDHKGTSGNVDITVFHRQEIFTFLFQDVIDLVVCVSQMFDLNLVTMKNFSVDTHQQHIITCKKPRKIPYSFDDAVTHGIPWECAQFGRVDAELFFFPSLACAYWSFSRSFSARVNQEESISFL